MTIKREYQVEVDDEGNRFWHLNNELHREDGPAIEWATGDKEGKRHRVDGPAVECAGGTKEWYLNGKLHREDGLAIEHELGYDWWYLNGDKLTEAEFNARQSPCDGKLSKSMGSNTS